MKILYVKNNSERTKEFQLKTVIYEDNGRKYVKKETIVDEAIPHLLKMKNSYLKLADSIINKKIKLAKVIDESENSLTFEFIDGVSLEKKYKTAIEKGNKEVDKVVNEYIQLVKTSFKTKKIDINEVSDDFKKIFGNIDYSQFNEELCFDGVSNIDLIFSNIIYKNDEIYLVDYEWVYSHSIPIGYTIFRALNNAFINKENYFSEKELLIFGQLEKSFVLNLVASKDSFFQVQHYYLKNRLNIDLLIQEKERQIQEKERQIQEKDLQIQEKERQIQEKDLQFEELLQIADSMRIKNRIKKLLGRYEYKRYMSKK